MTADTQRPKLKSPMQIGLDTVNEALAEQALLYQVGPNASRRERFSARHYCGRYTLPLHAVEYVFGKRPEFDFSRYRDVDDIVDRQLFVIVDALQQLPYRKIEKRLAELQDIALRLIDKM